MLSFSANLSMLFTEVDFLERFARASKAGFRAVECQFPYPYEVDELAAQLQRYQLALVLHNLPAGDWAGGERGVACLPDRVGEFQDGLGRAIEYATALGCPQVNCLAGLAPAAADHDTLHQTFVENLSFAARELKARGITLLIEPLNTRDTPGFFLRTSQQALGIIEEVGSDNLSLQLDVYHAHIMEGDAVQSIQRNASHIGHVQVADAPGRHEPGTGRIDFPAVFRALERANYAGWIGCEYVPSGTTEESLTWLTRSRDR
ncbi:MAG: hydroxypyruvate isomerase [Acidobacteria bacterium]|nr:MAG: hydroxypyruvate isomerase [Acidobacteriota bacterium]